MAGTAQSLGFQKVKENDHLPGRDQAVGEEAHQLGFNFLILFSLF